MQFLLRQHLNVRIRLGAFFFLGIAQFTTIPFMTIYFAHNFGAGPTGILLALTMLVAMVAGIVGGFVSDHIGRRRVLYGCEFVLTSAYAAMAAANSPVLHAPWLTFLAFMVSNAVWGIYGPVDEAMMLDVTAVKDRGQMYTVFYWMANLTIAIGSAVGGLMFVHYRFWLFASAAVLFGATCLSTVWFIGETHHPLPDQASPSFSGFVTNYRSVLKDRTFLRYLAAGTIMMAIETELQNGIGVHLVDHFTKTTVSIGSWAIVHLGGLAMLGFLRTENTVLVVALALFAGRFSRRVSDKWILGGAVGLFAMGYGLLNLATAPSMLFLAMMTATLGEVLSVPVRQSFLADLTPEHARSSYLAVHSLTFNVGGMMSALAVSLITIVPPIGMGLLTLMGGLAAIGCYWSILPAIYQRRQRILPEVESS